MTRRTALHTLAGAAALPQLGVSQTRRPNILFVMTDHQRWDAMSCAGNRILKTPHRDRLAAEGMRFGQAFVTNALCAPSRACLQSEDVVATLQCPPHEPHGEVR